MAEAVAPDPIDDLEHGHAELSALVLELRTLLTRVEQNELAVDEGASELADAAGAATDAMAIHFSREAEALFPFVEQRVSTLRARADALAADHDRICKRAEELGRACARLRAGGAIEPVAEALASLETEYAAHASAELAFLRDLGAALDAPGREELRVLLLGL